jgi:Domain of unknown function (DU1801)
MKTSDAAGRFRETVARSNPRVRQHASALRRLIFEVCPRAVEVPWSRQRIVGYGVGPKKMTEHFCRISPFGEHVNLGFNYGLDLPDPDQLLEGAGKRLRHMKIQNIGDVKRPALRKLLRAAVKERESALNKK